MSVDIKNIGNQLKFVEAQDVKLNDIPENIGQFIIRDNGELLYDQSRYGRYKIGGISVTDLRHSAKEIICKDYTHDGKVDIYDLLKSTEDDSEYTKEGDILVRIGTSSDLHFNAEEGVVHESYIRNYKNQLVPLCNGSAYLDRSIFTKNIKITEDIGKYKPSQNPNGYIELNTQGKSGVDVLLDILQVAKQPTILYPTMTVKSTFYDSSGTSLGTTTSTLNYQTQAKTKGNINLEVGTAIAKFVHVNTLDPGSYSYGPKPTGVKATGTQQLIYDGLGVPSYTFTGENHTGYGTDTVTTSLGLVYVRSSDYYIDLIVPTCAGSVAKNNLDGESNPPIKIPAYEGNSKCTTRTVIRGFYQGYLMGGLTNVAGTDITYMNVRSLTKKGSAFSAGTFTMTISAGKTIVVIAIPKGKRITKIENVTAGFPDVKGDFIKRTISVGGADATASDIGDFASDYDVYYYQPPTGAYVNATTFKVTLAN